MERKNFFGTLGAGLAGLTLLKPDLSTAEEIPIEKIQPVHLWDDPLGYNEMTDAKCRLYYKRSLLTSVQSIVLPSFSDEFYPGRKHMNNYINLFGCVYSEDLRKAFENDRKCTLIVDTNEHHFTLNVIIMELGIMELGGDINLEEPVSCNLEVSPIGEIVMS